MEEGGNSKQQMEYDVKEGKSRGCSGTLIRAIIVVLFLAMAACIIGLAVALVQKGKDKDSDDVTIPPTTPRTTDDADEVVSKAGQYRFGAVAADNVICSKIGTDILARQMGSTIDSVIATLLCLGVVNSHAMGIGGGFLLTMYNNQDKEVKALNSREVAPQAATEDMYVNKTGDLSRLGGLAIAVPSEIAGYAELHMRYGKLPWKDLFQPTIKLCEDGFEMPRAMSRAVDNRKSDVMAQPGLRELFLNSDGNLLVEGDLFKRPKLAETLRRIAEGGPTTFYTGSLADDVVADIQDVGGIITKEDLALVTPLWKDPIATTLSNGGYTLYGPPPPSSAVVLYYILNIMDGFNLTKASRDTVDDKTLLAHRLVEAMKFGYGKRSYLGDEDFVNVTEWKDLLQTKTFAEETRRKINDARVLAFEDYDSAFEIVNDGGTSHLSIYGPDGFAVSVTSTINTYLGSKMVGNRTGIIFNNEMDDFSTPGTVNNYGVAASPSNFIKKGKHPMSSMSPTIIMDKNQKVAGIIGASGGTRIITGTLETIMNNLWLGYNVSEALDQPRYHHQLLPDQILHEPIFPKEIRDKLAEKGHTFKVRELEFCVVQFVRLYCQENPSDAYCLHAACDMRRGGAPDGY